VQEQIAKVGLADTDRVLEHRVKYRLQFAGGAANHLEYVGGGGLLLQRLAQLVEQSGILNGDDGLFREVTDKFDLLVTKRSYLLEINGYCANRLAFLEHRYGHIAARATQLGCVIREKLAFRRGIGEADRLFRAEDVLECAPNRQLMGSPRPHEFGVRRRDVEFCRGAERAVLIVEHHAELCFADSRGVLKHGLEYRLQRARRA
jgi:hypothetical protein